MLLMLLSLACSNDNVTIDAQRQEIDRLTAVNERLERELKTAVTEKKITDEALDFVVKIGPKKLKNEHFIYGCFSAEKGVDINFKPTRCHDADDPQFTITIFRSYDGKKVTGLGTPIIDWAPHRYCEVTVM